MPVSIYEREASTPDLGVSEHPPGFRLEAV